NTTWPTSAGETLLRSRTARTTVAPSSQGGTSFRPPPKSPTALRQAPMTKISCILLSSNNGGGDCEAPQATKLALIVIQARSQQQRSFGCARKKNGGAEPRRLSPVSRNQRQSALDVLCRLAALGFFGVF